MHAIDWNVQNLVNFFEIVGCIYFLILTGPTVIKYAVRLIDEFGRWLDR